MADGVQPRQVHHHTGTPRRGRLFTLSFRPFDITTFFLLSSLVQNQYRWYWLLACFCVIFSMHSTIKRNFPFPIASTVMVAVRWLISWAACWVILATGCGYSSRWTRWFCRVSSHQFINSAHCSLLLMRSFSRHCNACAFFQILRPHQQADVRNLPSQSADYHRHLWRVGLQCPRRPYTSGKLL